MGQPFVYLDKEDPAVRGVLNGLWTFQALTYEQIASLVCPDNKQKVYDILKPLYKNGYIASRRNPENARVAYVTLTQKGVEEVGQPSAAWSPPRRDRVVKLLAINDLYFRLLAVGIPSEAVSRRKETLEHLAVLPSYTRVAAQVTGKDKTWLLYLREEGIRKNLLKSTNVVPSKYGHVVLYEDWPAKDIGAFLEQSVPQDFHCMQMDDLPSFKTLALEPEAFARKVKEHIVPHLPGEIVRLEECPFEYAWERSDGKRMILADLSTNNLGPVAAAVGLNINYAMDPKQNWGQGVLIFAKDEKSAKLWWRLIGHKEWLRLIRYDLPPGQSLFRSGETGWVPHGR